MIGIAILGAGIFAREEHLPAIETCDLFELKAVYSRSQNSAEALLQARGSRAGVDAYFDVPPANGVVDGRSLDDLLARKDIDAVVVCLSILAQPLVIEKALRAGKHVLSEKPIAEDVATARSLQEVYRSLASPPVWAVGENLRFIGPVVTGADMVKRMGGKLVYFSFSMFTTIGDDDKYFQTEWRKTPGYQGGFLLDGGVHFVAALRFLLNAAGQDIQHVAAFTSLLQAKLPPADTIHALMATPDGCSGTFCLSFGTEFKPGFELEAVTTTGRVTVSLVQAKAVGAFEETRSFDFDAGIKSEIGAFARSIVNGGVDARLDPDEAMKDLQVLQGMLQSGDVGGTKVDVRSTN